MEPTVSKPLMPEIPTGVTGLLLSLQPVLLQIGWESSSQVLQPLWTQMSRGRLERSQLLFSLVLGWIAGSVHWLAGMGMMMFMPSYFKTPSKMMGLCILSCTTHHIPGLQSILQTHLVLEIPFPLLPLQEGREGSLAIPKFHQKGPFPGLIFVA